jgi:hypothetical protein
VAGEHVPVTTFFKYIHKHGKFFSEMFACCMKIPNACMPDNQEFTVLKH